MRGRPTATLNPVFQSSLSFTTVAQAQGWCNTAWATRLLLSGHHNSFGFAETLRRPHSEDRPALSTHSVYTVAEEAKLLLLLPLSFASSRSAHPASSSGSEAHPLARHIKAGGDGRESLAAQQHKSYGPNQPRPASTTTSSCDPISSQQNLLPSTAACCPLQASSSSQL